MRDIRLKYDGDRATIMLVPSWLGRLFGARPAIVEVERYHAGWRMVASHVDLGYVSGGARIKRALDFGAVVELPVARVLREITSSPAAGSPRSRSAPT